MNNKKAIFIPLLILVYFFVHYIADLWYFLVPANTAFRFFKYAAVVTTLLFVGYKIFKRKPQFLLTFSTLLFLFLFYGSFIDTAIATKLMNPVNHIDFKMVFIFLSMCIVLAIVCFKLNDTIVKKGLQFWWIYCVVLIVYDLGFLIVQDKSEKKYVTNISPVKSISSFEKPSVFFLLFDMYPSDTVLKKYLHYNNSSITGFLKECNFFVAGNAHSLYDETYNSLASTLNLKQLDWYNDKGVKDYKKPLIALSNIENAFVPKLFQTSGYTFRNFSVFNIGTKKSQLQFNLNYHSNNALTASTFFNRCYDAFETDFFLVNRNIDLGFVKKSWSDAVTNDIAFLDNSFNRLLDSFPNEQPSVNYFHFMIPHPPVLFDSVGDRLAVKDMYAFRGFEETNRHFTGYIQYGNKMIERMVNKIFEKAGKNVMIVIQGDHGYREFHDQFPDKVRLGALNAVYLPGHNYIGFSDSMSTLSTFKQILKNQFQYDVEKQMN